MKNQHECIVTTAKPDGVKAMKKKVPPARRSLDRPVGKNWPAPKVVWRWCRRATRPESTAKALAK